jgi:hypothetical protein
MPPILPTTTPETSPATTAITTAAVPCLATAPARKEEGADGPEKRRRLVGVLDGAKRSPKDEQPVRRLRIKNPFL